MQHALRTIRHRRVRAKISGTHDIPRLAVFKSNQHIYAQLIDDVAGETRAAVSDVSLGDASRGKTLSERARLVGAEIARIAKEGKVEKAVFDRGGFRFHGVVAAVAEGAREAGLTT